MNDPDKTILDLPSFTTAQPISQGGEYQIRVELHNSPAYPMKGGQGDYQPRTAVLAWSTDDGTSWRFQHAVIQGPHIERRTGLPGASHTSQTIYLNDPGYPECTPVWLADLVAQMAPHEGRA
jgi:hypothetical protein